MDIEMHGDLYKEIKDYVDTFDDDEENDLNDAEPFNSSSYLYVNHQQIAQSFEDDGHIEVVAITAHTNKLLSDVYDKYNNASFFSSKFYSIDSFYEYLEDDGLKICSYMEDFDTSELQYEADDAVLQFTGTFMDTEDYNLIFLMANIKERLYPFNVLLGSGETEFVYTQKLGLSI